jgi:hypothetical protein
MADGWDLITEGRYADAIATYTEDLVEHAHAPTLRNRATAHLLAGQLTEAKKDVLAAMDVERPPSKPGNLHSDGDLLRLGVIEWLEGDHVAAARRWLTTVSALQRDQVEYSDACGGGTAGSLLTFAAARLSDPSYLRVASALFKSLRKRRRIESWPGPVVEFYVGVRTEESLLARVSSVPILRERELCQAHFAIAVSRLLEHDKDRFGVHIREAASYKAAIHEEEFFLACYEADPAQLVVVAGGASLRP